MPTDAEAGIGTDKSITTLHSDKRNLAMQAAKALIWPTRDDYLVVRGVRILANTMVRFSPASEMKVARHYIVETLSYCRVVLNKYYFFAFPKIQETAPKKPALGDVFLRAARLCFGKS
jgi:hypothetical protein